MVYNIKRITKVKTKYLTQIIQKDLSEKDVTG